MSPVWIPGRVISGHTFKKKDFNIAKLKLEIRGNHAISFRFLQEVARTDRPDFVLFGKHLKIG